MKIRLLLFATLLAIILSGCSGTQEVGNILPPEAKKEPVKLEMHGDVRIDEYFWLRDRENPEVIAHLEAENAYTAKMMAHTEELQEKLFNEIVARIEENDESVPVFKKGYYYYTRYVEGGDYPLYCRKKGSLDAEEEIMLDVNKLAEGHSFFSVRSVSVSPENDLLAYAYDTVGRRKYTIVFKNLESGEKVGGEISEVTGNLDWANDNKTIFYTRQDPDTLRSYQVYRYNLDSDESGLIYQEDDVTFSVGVSKTKSDSFILIRSDQTMSTEYRYLSADDPNGEFQLIQPRERGLEYSVDHYGSDFYIRTNLDAENFKLVKTPVSATTKENWETVIENREDVFFQGFEIFSNYLVVTERSQGLRQIRIMPWDGSGEHYIEFDEPVYVAFTFNNPEFDTDELRFAYQSLKTPNTVYDYNMATRDREMLKQDAVLGGYDPADYTTERLWAEAADGTQVPISLVYKTDMFSKDGSNPCLLYAYGSYGSSREPTFSSPRISLLDRGFVFALAHVRGGQEMGRYWYEEGKLLNKKNTFTDFNDVARHLINENYTDSDKLFAQGGSAGGLLMGAIANMEPELYKGILAMVPWVDVVTTMLDDSIPLTTAEYDEWGNPNEKEYYDYMLSYSPYDNVKAQAYPNLLVTTGLHDSQVQYWEPAKWVAKLREMKTDDNLLVFKINMEAGHGGASGRYERYRETAFYYAFMLDLVGISE